MGQVHAYVVGFHSRVGNKPKTGKRGTDEEGLVIFAEGHYSIDIGGYVHVSAASKREARAKALDFLHGPPARVTKHPGGSIVHFGSGASNAILSHPAEGDDVQFRIDTIERVSDR